MNADPADGLITGDMLSPVIDANRDRLAAVERHLRESSPELEGLFDALRAVLDLCAPDLDYENPRVLQAWILTVIAEKLGVEWPA